MEIEGEIKLKSKSQEKLAFTLAACTLKDAGFKQVMIFATRLGRADDTEKIDKSDPKELEKYGLRIWPDMDTVTLLASVGCYVESLIKKHPEDKPKVAQFVARLAEAVMNSDTEAVN